MIEITDIRDVERYVDDIKVILFDLDDTLYSEKDYVRSGFHLIAKRFPEIPDAEKMLWEYFTRKEPAIDRFLKKIGADSAEIKETCLTTYRNQMPDIRLYSGVHEMLTRLHERHKLGLITDGRPEGQRAKIKALGIGEMFDNIIITDELGGIGFRKPNPKAFEIMAEFFGVDYTDMCYIGDNPGKDFIAPERLGILAIWFRNADGVYYAGE